MGNKIPDDLVKELWEIRFNKLMQSEIQSWQFYRELLEKKKELLTELNMTEVVKEIMQDEARHIELAKMLLSLVQRKDQK